MIPVPALLGLVALAVMVGASTSSVARPDDWSWRAFSIGALVAYGLGLTIMVLA